MSQDKTLIIDVREPFEYASGHVQGAINIPPMELLEGARQLTNASKDTEIILYCRTGARSNMAIQILREKGFTNLVNGINRHHVEARYS